jgi:hypothetical protein
MLEITVHAFRVGDVEDPEIYAAQPLWEWQNSEVGKWVMAHAVETPVYHQSVDYMSYGYRYVIRAKLTDQDAFVYRLKWG